MLSPSSLVVSKGREGEETNPPERFWDRLASFSGEQNMAESAECTNTHLSHMSSETNEK